MSQQNRSYLLNLNRFPNFVSPWTKRNLLPSVTPEKLFDLAENYFIQYPINWDNSTEVIGGCFKAFTKDLKQEISVRILGEFVILYWFYVADINEISNEIKDIWLKWHLQQINRNYKLKHL